MTPPPNERQHIFQISKTMLEEKDLDRFPVRKHPRLKNYNYTTANYYFVTLCTHNKDCLFGEPSALSQMGQIAQMLLLEIPTHFPGTVVDKCVVMPNHIHGIIVLPGGTAELSVIIGQYKAAVTKSVRRFYPNICLWQRSFHDHIIRNQGDYERIWTYIEGNPSKWAEDCFYVP